MAVLLSLTLLFILWFFLALFPFLVTPGDSGRNSLASTLLSSRESASLRCWLAPGLHLAAATFAHGTCLLQPLRSSTPCTVRSVAVMGRQGRAFCSLYCCWWRILPFCNHSTTTTDASDKLRLICDDLSWALVHTPCAPLGHSTHQAV